MNRFLTLALILCLPALIAADTVSQVVSTALVATGDPALGVAAKVAEQPSSFSWPLAMVVGVWIVSREMRRAIVDAAKLVRESAALLRGWRPVVTLRNVQAYDTDQIDENGEERAA